MKVPKVVLIVVALHVVVIGGFLLFEAFNREKPVTPDISSNESLPGQQPDIAAQPPETVTPPVPSTTGMTPAQPGMMLPPPQEPVVAPPAPPAPAERTYTVVKGDSLWKISRAEGVRMDDLARANNLTKTSVLKVGQKLVIPAVTAPEPINIATGSIAPTSATPGMGADTTGSADLYAVQSGDSLWKIARQHNLSVQTLKQANGLTTDNLKVGQKLRIPLGASAPTTTAASTPTASAPAAAVSGGSWNINGFREPGSYQEGGQMMHSVNHGETIDNIARQYGVSAASIIQANKISDPKKLWFGQVLIIPQGQQSSAMAVSPATP